MGLFKNVNDTGMVLKSSKLFNENINKKLNQTDKRLLTYSVITLTTGNKHYNEEDVLEGYVLLSVVPLQRTRKPKTNISEFMMDEII